MFERRFVLTCVLSSVFFLKGVCVGMVSETTYNISGAQIGNELLASTRSLTSSG